MIAMETCFFGRSALVSWRSFLYVGGNCRPLLLKLFRVQHRRFARGILGNMLVRRGSIKETLACSGDESSQSDPNP